MNSRFTTLSHEPKLQMGADDPMRDAPPAISLEAELQDSDCMSPTDRLVSPISGQVDMLHRKFQRGAKIFKGEPLQPRTESRCRSCSNLSAAARMPSVAPAPLELRLTISLDADPVDSGLRSPTDKLSPTSSALAKLHGKPLRKTFAQQQKENFELQGRPEAAAGQGQPARGGKPLTKPRRASPLSGG